MPLEHQELFAHLPMALVGSMDAARRPWASILVGSPGFVHAMDERTLRIDTMPAPGDPLADALAVGQPLGLLGIELASRRRNRMNGTVTARDAGGFSLAVDQSFGNCPQYIQARRPTWRRDPESFRDARAVERIGARLEVGARRRRAPIHSSSRPPLPRRALTAAPTASTSPIAAANPAS